MTLKSGFEVLGKKKLKKELDLDFICSYNKNNKRQASLLKKQLKTNKAKELKMQNLNFNTKFIIVEHGTNAKNWKIHVMSMWELENLVNENDLTYEKAEQLLWNWQGALGEYITKLENNRGSHTILGSTKAEAVECLNSSIDDLDLSDEWDKQQLVMLEKQKRAIWELDCE